MLDYKSIDNPIEHNHCLVGYLDQVSTDRACYQRLDGHLIYLAHARTKIAYTIVRILRYLKSTTRRRVMFSKHNKTLEVCGFTDANWARSITDIWSTFGYFTFVGGNLVTLKSKK